MSVQEAVVVDGGRSRTRHECSKFQVRSALRRLQRRFDLRPSGRLDDDTRILMSRGRCGNVDNVLKRQPETVSRQTGSRGRQRRSVDGDGLQLEPEIVGGQTGSGQRQRRGNSNADVQRPELETVLNQAGRSRRLRRSTDDDRDMQPELENTLQHTGSTVRQRINNSTETGSTAQQRIYNTTQRPEMQTVLRLGGIRGQRMRLGEGENETTGSTVQQKINNTTQRPEMQTVLRLSGIMRQRENETNVPVRVPIARRAAEVTPLSAVIDHADLHSRLIPGTDHEPGAALNRRTKMFFEIRKRHRLRIAAEGLEGDPVQRNHTEEELVAIRRRIRNGRAQRAAGIDGEVQTSPQRRRRHRRSISVPSFDEQVNEGPASESASTGFEELVRFQKNGNSPVKWRLLADGVSGKIPLIDQRAILELAFRMWSEVIPLKFHESNSIDVVDMDVIIAFAKRKYLFFIATDADGSRVGIAIIRVCDFISVCVCPHDKTKMAKTKIAKFGTGITILRPPMNIKSKVKGQG